jgi:hypothetical protein
MTWTIEELGERVRRPLESPAPVGGDRDIRVLGLNQRGDSLVIDIVVSAPPTMDCQRWQLDFRSMWADVRELPLDAAALTVRANIEEWWDTGAEEDGPGGLVTARRAG